MSLHQEALETASIFHVVGTRTTGERVMISEHVGLPVAEKIVSVTQRSGNFSEIFIECDGKRLSSWGASTLRDH
jgi:hypothetical protein